MGSFRRERFLRKYQDKKRTGDTFKTISGEITEKMAALWGSYVSGERFLTKSSPVADYRFSRYATKLGLFFRKNSVNALKILREILDFLEKPSMNAAIEKKPLHL